MQNLPERYLRRVMLNILVSGSKDYFKNGESEDLSELLLLMKYFFRR